MAAASVWNTPAIDVKNSLILFATGNPNPDLDGSSRKGDNAYADSIVAIDATTGKLQWWYQEVAHDVWDYDACAPVVLFDTVDEHGNVVPAAAEAGKVGNVFIVNRLTGKLIRKSEPFVMVKREFHEAGDRHADHHLSRQQGRRDVVAAGLFAAHPLFLHHGRERGACLRRQPSVSPHLYARHADRGPVQPAAAWRPKLNAFPPSGTFSAINTSTPARSPGSTNPTGRCMAACWRPRAIWFSPAR